VVIEKYEMMRKKQQEAVKQRELAINIENAQRFKEQMI
jgi:hypothetical protein